MMIIIKLIAHLLLITKLSDGCSFDALLAQSGGVCSRTTWDQSDKDPLKDPLTWVNVGTTMLSDFLPMGGFQGALSLMTLVGARNEDSFGTILTEMFNQVVQCIDTKIATSTKTTVENEVIYAAKLWYQMASDPNKNYVGLPDLATKVAGIAVRNFGESSTKTLTITEAEVLLASSKMLSDIYWLILTAELGSYKDNFYKKRSTRKCCRMYDIDDVAICKTYKSRIDMHLEAMGYLLDWIQRAIDLIREHYKPTRSCDLAYADPRGPFQYHLNMSNKKNAVIFCDRFEGYGLCESAPKTLAITAQVQLQFEQWVQEEIEDNFIARVEQYVFWIERADQGVVCDAVCPHQEIMYLFSCIGGYNMAEILISKNPPVIKQVCLDDRFKLDGPSLDVCYSWDPSFNPCHDKGTICEYEGDCEEFVVPHLPCPDGWEEIEGHCERSCNE